MNNADFGLTLQSLICDYYDLEVNETASEQFSANFNESYIDELRPLCSSIFAKIGSKPVKLLTYTRPTFPFVYGRRNSVRLNNVSPTTSPHTFLLENGQTVSLRTLKTRDKVAPKTLGQAGYPILNDFFGDIYGKPITTQEDIDAVEILSNEIGMDYKNYGYSMLEAGTDISDMTENQIINLDSTAYQVNGYKIQITFLNSLDATEVLYRKEKLLEEINKFIDKKHIHLFVLTIVNIIDSTIYTDGLNSGGIMASGGGIMNATDLTVSTYGQFSAPIKSYKGGGEITVNGPSFTGITASSTGTGFKAGLSYTDGGGTAHDTLTYMIFKLHPELKNIYKEGISPAIMENNPDL